VTTGAADAWHLLEYCCAHDSSSDEIESLLTDVDWNQLTVIALTQRMLPRLADFVLVSGGMGLVPRQFRRILVEARQVNRGLGAAATAEADRVTSALTANGVPAVCTKGVVFQSSLYHGSGGRMFDDIDVMIHPENARRAAATMTELGYLSDLDYQHLTDSLVPRSRRDLAMYRLFPDHLPHFHLPLTGQVRPFFVVDICFNITWYGAAWHVPMDEVLADVRRVGVTVPDGTVDLPALTEPYDFVFAVTHLFREAWFERTLNGNRLSQFGDILRLWKQLDASGVAGLAALVERHAIAPPVAWVGHHVDTLFGSDIVAGLGLDDHRDEAWLHSACAENGSYLSWTGDMRERLRSAGPLSLVSAPEPRFAAAARAGLR